MDKKIYIFTHQHPQSHDKNVIAIYQISVFLLESEALNAQPV